MRRYAGQGCELWRALFSEAKGYSPEVTRAKAEKVQRPPRSANLNTLLEDLGEWEFLFNEVTSGGYHIATWTLELALKDLVPLDQLRDFKLVPGLDATGNFEAQLSWVRTRISQHRATAQAAPLGDREV